MKKETLDMNEKFFSAEIVADVLSVSKRNLISWSNNGKLIPDEKSINGKVIYNFNKLKKFPEFSAMANSLYDDESLTRPKRKFKCVELFAGAGGLAVGLERAGFDTLLLNEIDKSACKTLLKNRPNWNVIEGDISNISFEEWRNKIDLLTGGFPCQAFSYAGKSLGFEDTRGTLFFEFARSIKEINPPVFMAENVRGLLTHDGGKTLETIRKVISDMGYSLVEESVYKAIFYKVPQKRERLILIGVRNDLLKKANFQRPSPYHEIMTVRDALRAGKLYDNDVPESEGQLYPKRKKEILEQVPEGRYWRDLPENLQKEYMKGSFYLGGGKTGMARRLAWDEPSLTLTTSPAQKQTERCHPSETRPLTVREYARIQTFPDDWEFCGSTSAIYKQIGNAVPVSLGESIAKAIVRMLNEIL